MNPTVSLHLFTLLGGAGVCLFAGWLLGALTPDMLVAFAAWRRALRREPRVPEPSEMDDAWRKAVQERNRVLAEQSGARPRGDVALDGRPLIDRKRGRK